MLLEKFKDICKDLPSLIDFDYPEDIEMTVCGDTHG